jgi:hypothetical protein
MDCGLLDPDPGGPKDPQNKKNEETFNAGCSLLRDEGFSCSLDVLLEVYL